MEKTERLAQLEHQTRVKRLAELEEKQAQVAYRDRQASSSLDSSNYDTPPGSPAPTSAKPKGKLKKNIDQVTIALSFSFRDPRQTRSYFRKKDGTGWPSKS